MQRSKHSEFYFYAGNKFKCLSNSNGIYLKNDSIYGATIHIEAGDIEFDTSTCSLSTDNDGSANGQDLIWLHPTPSKDMYLGHNNGDTTRFTLSENELNLISSASTAKLYLGDRPDTNNVANVYINTNLTILQDVSSSIYIGANMPQSEVIFSDYVDVEFNNQNVYLYC